MKSLAEWDEGIGIFISRPSDFPDNANGFVTNILFKFGPDSLTDD